MKAYRAVRLSVIAIVAAVLAGLFLVDAASAQDGYRLCALRKGACLCQSPADAPGTWTELPASRCTPSTPASASSPAATSASTTTSAAAAAAAASPTPVIPAVPAATTGGFSSAFGQVFDLFKSAKSASASSSTPPAASAAAPAIGVAAADGMRLCAERRGVCTCHAAGDPPGTWTIMEPKRCQSPSSTGSSPAIAAAPALASPPSAKSSGVGVASSAANAPAQKSVVASSSAKAPAPQTKAPAAVASRNSADQMSECALRNGLCTCKGAGDGPGKWTLVDNSRCKLLLLSGLSSAPATELSGNPTAVRNVQIQLARLGYKTGAASGSINASTTDAIKQFQEAYGMHADGRMTDLLVERLRLAQPN